MKDFETSFLGISFTGYFVFTFQHLNPLKADKIHNFMAKKFPVKTVTRIFF